MSLPTLSQFAFWQSRRLPVLLQTEAAECGLACLGMVASYWGHEFDMASLRRRYTISLKGVTLKSLMTMATGLHLQTRPIKLDIESLPKLKLPCILHWDMNHFVVLKSISFTHAVVHDPAIGMRRVALEEFSNHFTGVALELSPQSQFERRQEKLHYSLRSLMGRVLGLKRGLGQLLILGLSIQVCALVAPFYMQWLVDEALLAADKDLVTVLGCGFLLLTIMQMTIAAVRSWSVTVLSTNMNIQWLNNAFGHLMQLPLPFFEKRHTGDIVSRFGSIQTIQRSLTTQFVEGIIDGVLMIGTLTMMLLYSYVLAAVAIVSVILYVFLRAVLYRAMCDASAEQVVHAAKQQSHFMESVRGIQSVRLFGRTEERRTYWLNALTDQFNADLRVAKLSVSYQALNNLLFGGERVILIWMAALAVLNHQFSVGMLFAFISYRDQFSQRTAALVDKLFELRMLRVHGDRVADILLTEPESRALDTTYDVSNLAPTIELRNVSFRYSEAEPEVVSDLSLLIPAGQNVAITGPSGCGKTTLVKLILGLLEPSGGKILVGGVERRQIGMEAYRQLIGTVMQDDVLFAGSIAENISFFDPAPDMERIMYCAQLVSIADEIRLMPMTFNTLVGDIGSGLSGGQKQRILLARALYRNPLLLVLDEATSHLDIHNEKAVSEAIGALKLTRIIIAHRPETILMSERVVVLHGGKILHDNKASDAWKTA